MCDALLVGFEPEDTKRLKNIFEEFFFNVSFLPDQPSAEKAYELAQYQSIDLLLLDLSREPADKVFTYKMTILSIQPNIKVILFDANEKLSTPPYSLALWCHRLPRQTTRY